MNTLITQFEIFVAIIIMQMIFKGSRSPHKEYEWYVLLIALALSLLVMWLGAGVLERPINEILSLWAEGR